MNPYKIEIPMLPFEQARQWRGGGGFMYQEKMDGEFATLAWGASCPEGHRALLAGERLADGRFVAFDLVELAGADLRSVPCRERWQELCNLAREFGPGVELVRTGNGGEFLEAVLAAGGEGVVAKELASPYGWGVWKAKRAEVFYGMITEKRADGRSGVRVGLISKAGLATAQPGADLPDGGWLPARAVFDRVRVGSVVKLVAFGRQTSGLLREARFDKDTPTSWLVRY
jgi:hypothetical protein